MNLRRRNVSLVLAMLVLVACGVDDDPGSDPAPVDEEAQDLEDDEEEAPTEDEEPDDVESPAADLDVEGLGILTGQADGSVDDAVAAIEEAASDGEAAVAFEVDHAQAADDAGLDLPATTLLAVDYPEASAALLEEEPLMGLDLPAKVLIWDDGGVTKVGVNEPPFLAQRYEMDLNLEILSVLDEAQRELLDAVGVAGFPAGLNPVASPQGLEVLDSEDGFDATLDRARAAIEAAGPELIAEVDHAAAAAEVDVELGGNTLLVFGDPQVGTELMASERTAGIDLPQKLLVYEVDGQTRVAYTEPEYLEERHLLAGVEGALAGTGDLLADLASAAASGE